MIDVNQISVLFSTLILCSHLAGYDCGATKEQMMKTGRMFRQVCQPKHKVPDDILDAGRNGVFADTKDFKCYVSCLLDMMQVTRKGKVNYESSLKQIDQFIPDDMKGDFRKGLDACKDAAQGMKNHCDAAFTLLKCFHANNPQFVFP
ncbi:general odorant-binding protein 72-like isoform X2 [Toxorhynchites rutilus septentrionalis]|uniref:general odorant-binding protein 72-like isoform X2 n=1 Tax=Toxorhynchites rutilus septentrionalis TaxID=329112 RepID=UPI00247AEA64|nr:general odorant-binding protein 72-like isoform X2 [Toxorhynchites rutilus septentrionalis]